MWGDSARLEDLSDIIYAISPEETPFIGRLGGRRGIRRVGGAMRARKRKLYAGMSYRRTIRTVLHEWKTL